MAERECNGIFNVMGPEAALTMGKFLAKCRTVSGSDVAFTWINDNDLLAENISPWTEMPLWMPENDPEAGGMLLGDNSKALSKGLVFGRWPTPFALRCSGMVIKRQEPVFLYR